jgi:hypothetical protein
MVAARKKMKEEVEQIDEKNEPTNPELWSRAKALARSKFDVYPSAYANGWASKWYKGKGGSWKSVSEETEIKEAIKDKLDIGEYDQEGDMAKSDLRSIMANAKRVHDMLEDSDNLPEWVQSKITKAEDYMSTVANYLSAEMSEEYERPIKKDPSLYKKPNSAQKNYKRLSTQDYFTGEYKGNVRKRKANFEEVDAIGLAKPKTALTAAAKTLAPQTRVAEASKPPFDKPYTTIKATITDKSGAKHTPMSRARDIARMAMKKQVEKMKQPVKESLDESRRMEIVREAMKVAKKKKETMAADDKYQSEPMLSSQITKT